MNISDSFKLGFKYGKRTGREMSAREISNQFPNADLDAFAQGNIDGVKADRFRLAQLGSCPRCGFANCGCVL